MSNKVMGRAQIKVNGTMLESMPGAVLDPGGVARTTVVAANSIAGFTEQLRQSKLEIEIAYKAKTSLKEIGGWDDVTVTFEADTGQTYVISHGWNTEPSAITDNEGKAKIVIEGPPAEEMMS